MMDIRFEVLPGRLVRPHVDGVAQPQFALSVSFNDERLNGQFDSGDFTRDELLDKGSRLWDGLCPKPLRQQILDVMTADEGHAVIRVDLPEDGSFDDFPWEAMLDTVTNHFLGCHPQCSLIRTPPRDVQQPAWHRRNEGPVRLLIVVPEGSGLQVGDECTFLRRLAKSSGNAEVEVLAGKVTVGALDAKLRESQWDVLHYIGHGACDENGEVRITFNRSPGSMTDGTIDALTFAQLLADRRLQLAVMNCCVGAAPGESRINAGLGPHLTRTARIPAVVAMRYEIADEDAVGFANAFYSELFTGRSRGRVDVAAQMARRALVVNPEYSARGFATPVLYLEQGREQLFSLASEPVRERVAAKKRTNIDLPPALLDAFQQRQLVAVVGAGLHAGETQRRANAGGGMPTLLEIVRAVADESQYPDRAEIEFAETAGDGFLSIVMSRVFQHFQSQHKRLGLIRKLAMVCAHDTVPEALSSIASWDIPGYVYTHFDGLMQDALVREHKQPCVLNVIPKEASARKEPPVLLNLRGTLRIDRPALTDKLVLTDREHELRFDELAKPAPDLLDLFTGDGGRAVLFLGVSPRDPLVRRLCSQHLDTSPESVQGPRFFVHKSADAAEEAYWQTFDVAWIRESPLAVIETLTQMADA
jgi:hypothetical protein